MALQLLDVLFETNKLHVCMPVSALALITCHRLMLLVCRLHSPHPVCDSWLMHPLAHQALCVRVSRGTTLHLSCFPAAAPNQVAALR